MAGLTESAVQGIELEQWQKMVPDLIGEFETLYKWFKKGTKSFEVSNVTNAPGTTAGTFAPRPSFRVMMRIQSGAAITATNFDGGALGTGTGSQWVSGSLSPVGTSAGCQMTYTAERATTGKNRAMLAVSEEELKNSLKSYLHGLESLWNGDSTGTLDTIPSTATVNNNTGSGVQTSSIVGLNNANQFGDQQTVQVYSSGGTLRGTFVISYADGPTNTIFSSTALPAGTTTTDNLVLAGTANNSAGATMNGIKSFQQTGNSGNVLGIPRANFPGRLSTPSVNLSGAPINPALPFRAQINIERALGNESGIADEFVWYVGPDQQLAVNNMYQPVVIANLQEVKGDTQLDMVKKYMPETFGGRKLIVGYNQTPGRLDALYLPSWGVAEMVEPSLYPFGNGETSQPIPDFAGSGSYLASRIFFYHSILNIFNSNMRAQYFVTNAQIPTI